ncbi:MAG: thermonuclease family protein [Candidatus Omnitrophica bacterium]|nr:thermonuclease family protein [Candidatus Omnitrophota bacterium]
MKYLLPVILILLLTLSVFAPWLAICQGQGRQDAVTSATPIQKDIYNNIKVTRVIDGETLELENGERVRLIGIDTPEMDDEKWEKAYEFTKMLVEGKKVRLGFDVQEKDKYGRLLAYVFIDYPLEMKIKRPAWYYFGRNNRNNYLFINATIVRAGYANLMIIPPNVKYADLFQRLYQEEK